MSRAAKRGGFKTGGGFPDLDLSFLFFVLFRPFCPFWDFADFCGIFPICSGMVRGFSRFVLFLFLSLLRAPTRNSPERVRDTIWTFPEKSGNPPPPVWKHPGLASPKRFAQHWIDFFTATFCRGGHALSGPVLRDTARLSQRYPPIARYGVFGVSTWPIGCDTPSPFFWAFPLWRACQVEVRYPHPKGVSQQYWRDTLWKQGKWVRYPPLRYYLERVLRDRGGYLALGR